MNSNNPLDLDLRDLKSCDYCQSQADHTMFYKHNSEGNVAILIVYVYDIILTWNDNGRFERLKNRLAINFESKDLGALKYFIRMEFVRSKRGIFFNHRKYVLDLLDETGMLECKPTEISIYPNIKQHLSKIGEVLNRE